MKKFEYIDALRGIAILAVILVHTAQYTGFENIPEILARVCKQGARGVQLFYVASAFTLFLSHKLRSGKELYSTSNFFIRRFFRIAPLYYFGIVYYLIQDGFGARYWLGDQSGISAANILSNATFTHDFNPYWINSLVPGGWSIGIEMTFYALLPFLFTKIKNLNQAFNFFLFTILLKYGLHKILLAWAPIPEKWLWQEFLYFYLPGQLPVFALGIIMYFVAYEKQSIRSISTYSMLLFAGLILLQQTLGIGDIFPNHIVFGIAFLILGVALSQKPIFLLVNPVITYIGKISFGLYLAHFAVLHWLKTFGMLNLIQNQIINISINYLVAIALSSVVASILFYTLESWFQNVGKKIISQRENRKKVS